MHHTRSSLPRLFGGLLLLTVCPAFSATLPPNLAAMTENSIPQALQIFVLLTMLSLVPAALMLLSSFTRIIIVLSMLRSALGLQQTPPNSVLTSLALILTILTMLPVGTVVWNDAIVPWEQQSISAQTALHRAEKPVRRFLLAQTREKDLHLILKLAHAPVPDSVRDIRFLHLVPAFLLSELQTAFRIGFMVFLPFLLVDLVVSGILLTMGMMMVPPMTIALPIKLLLFVLIDGWDLLVASLVGSFHM